MQSGLSFVVDQLACSSMGTACITIMHDQTCQASCKPHSSLGTWLAFAMVSFSCLGLSDSVLLCFSFVTYTALSSASSYAPGLPKGPVAVCLFPFVGSFQLEKSSKENETASFFVRKGG